MQCPHCKTLNPATAATCVKCGAPLALSAAPRGVMHGRYTILNSLGKGGMGALYLASETIANRQRLVVVKEMLEYFDPRDPRSEEKARKRFEAEAETLASLNIAGVPQIFDYFTEGGRYYIVMQFIEGQNLETGLTHLDENGDLVNGRPYLVDQVRRWGARLCKILEGLAAQNVFHLDIKPANLVVDRAGDIWLVDFGTAKALRFAAPPSQVGLQKSSVYGTIGYAPPEQIAGKAEARSDVYALAATLYHLMTDDDPRDKPGQFPHFDRLPSEVAQALRPALEKDPRRRAAAAELGNSLEMQGRGAPAFHWRDGTSAYQPKDLAATADRNWEEARDYFSGDEWEKWLKDLHRHDLIAQLRAVKGGQPNADLALDAFLRLLEPNFPMPSLHLPQPTLDAGALPWQSKCKLDLKVVNQGSGCLQGQFVKLSPALRVEPAVFTFHDWRQVQVTVDAGALSPAPARQTLKLDVDAGPGGKLQLPVIVTVPEPNLRLDRARLEPGNASRGEKLRCTLQVSNAGGSAFLGEVKSSASWLSVKPTHFYCAQNKSILLTVFADARDMKIGKYAAELAIFARAGRWEQTLRAPVTFRVTWFKNFLKHWLPAWLWVFFWSMYGFLAGHFLGFVLGFFLTRIEEAATGIFSGSLIGALIFAFPGALLGLLGGIGNEHGWKGTKRGALYGWVAGVLAGALAGLFVFYFLTWLGVMLSAGFGLLAFGSLVGLLSSAFLGTLLWFASRK